MVTTTLKTSTAAPEFLLPMIQVSCANASILSVGIQDSVHSYRPRLVKFVTVRWWHLE